MDLGHDPVKVNIPARITKSKKKRITFISREAVQYLKQWLKYRGRFGQRASSRRSEYQFDLNDLRLFPFSNVNFSSKWNVVCEKAGFGERDTNTKVDVQAVEDNEPFSTAFSAAAEGNLLWRFSYKPWLPESLSGAFTVSSVLA